MNGDSPAPETSSVLRTADTDETRVIANLKKPADKTSLNNDVTRFLTELPTPLVPKEILYERGGFEVLETKVFNEHITHGGADKDFLIAPPGNMDDTIAAAPLPSPAQSGSRPLASGTRRGSSSHLGLDLSERVMGTISRSTAPLVPEADDGIFGIHKILRTHQRGGMGRILIAYDQYLKRDVALKELHPEVAEDESIVRRFIGEAEITAQLEHPGIVPIHSLNLDKDGFPYYTMKLIKGHTLQEAIKTYHRNPTRQELMGLVRRLVSISKTMAFAHSKGVIHRDLKPANIMLGEHGETLVMDWGLAKPFLLDSNDSEYISVAIEHKSESRPELTMVGAIVGTPAFMSPEQASPEESVVGPLSDIFSIGTVLYYLLAGQTAFSGRSTQEVLNKVRAAAPQRPSEIKPNVPLDLEAVCFKAMAKNPKERYQTATELVDDLCRWLDSEPVTARPETAPQKIRRWFSKHRLISVSIPVVLILITVITSIAVHLNMTRWEKTQNELVQSVLNNPVDLTDYSKMILFSGSSGVDVSSEPRQTGGMLLTCDVPKVPPAQQGVIQITAPASLAWDITNRYHLTFSLFEGLDKPGDLEMFFVRLGQGSSYFEYRPAEDFWAKRKRSNWFPYFVPLNGSDDWQRTQSGVPLMNRIEWIEFHFGVKEPLSFRIDNISIR
jgi:serine/threonine protein kinase